MSSELVSAEKKPSPEKPSFLINSLPDDLIVDILARVSRFNYPNLSLVSKHFESHIASPELYARRSSLGCTEHCIYMLVNNLETDDDLLHILHQEANSNRLVFIQLLPPRSSIVAVGSKIYVFGGFYDSKLTTTVLRIDCRSHKVQPLPTMPMLMAGKVIDMIDEKIYMIGYCNDDDSEKVMMVFDTQAKMWEPNMTKVDMEIGHIWVRRCVVMADNMYMRDFNNSFVYRPKENKGDADAMLNSEKWGDACLVEDVLYYYDHDTNKLRAYDTKRRLWGVVKGVGQLLPEPASLWWSSTVNYGGKLVVFLHRYDYSSGKTMFRCGKIALERRRGNIWGEVECSDFVLDGNLLLMKSLVVTV